MNTTLKMGLIGIIVAFGAFSAVIWTIAAAAKWVIN